MHRVLGLASALALIVVCVLLGVLVGGALAGTGAPVGQVVNETNVTQHEDPSVAAGAGNLGRVEAWLERHLAGRLSEHSLRISQGQYEQAEGLVGDAFEQRLGQYVDVAGETGGDDGEETAESFSEAKDHQQNVSAATQEYEATTERYQDAKERGDEAAARTHARRLDALATRIERNAQAATAALAAIENQTGVSTGASRERLSTEAQTVTAQTAEITAEIFLATRLHVTANVSRASFVAPARLAGSVTAENGSSLADRRIRLRAGGWDYDVETGPFGLFSVPFRPVTVPAGAEAVTVAYRPADAAPYLGSNASVPLEIEPVQPTVDVAVEPATVRAGENVTVAAAVAVGDRPVPGVPVAVRVANRVVGTGVTDADGSVSVTAAVPPSQPGGTVPVSASIATEGRAIAAASGETTVTVRAAGTPDQAATPATDAAATEREPADGGLSLGLVVLGLLIILVGVAGGGVVWWRLRSGPERPADPAVPATSEPEPESADLAGQWLAAARAALGEGAVEGAVANAYAAAYDHVAAAQGIGRDRTPRELLAAAEDGLSAADRVRLATLTDIYERTIFAARGDDGDGERAVDIAAGLVGGASADRGSVADD